MALIARRSLALQVIRAIRTSLYRYIVINLPTETHDVSRAGTGRKMSNLGDAGY